MCEALRSGLRVVCIGDVSNYDERLAPSHPADFQ
jgi:hypothetical protein